MSAIEKGDDEMIPGAVHRFPGICLTAEENPGKPQLGERLKKALRSVIASNRVPYIQVRSLGSHSTLVKDKEGKDRIYINIANCPQDAGWVHPRPNPDRKITKIEVLGNEPAFSETLGYVFIVISNDWNLYSVETNATWVMLVNFRLQAGMGTPYRCHSIREDESHG